MFHNLASRKTCSGSSFHFSSTQEPRESIRTVTFSFQLQIKSFPFLKYIIHKCEQSLPCSSFPPQIGGLVGGNCSRTPLATLGLYRTGSLHSPFQPRTSLGPPGFAKQALCQGWLGPTTSQSRWIQTVNFSDLICCKGQS